MQKLHSQIAELQLPDRNLKKKKLYVTLLYLAYRPNLRFLAQVVGELEILYPTPFRKPYLMQKTAN